MPWLPKTAGEHGYGFIDRWCDGDELSEKPLQCAMFMPADEKGERWRYFGQYLLDRMVPVSRDDWLRFNEDVRVNLRYSRSRTLIFDTTQFQDRYCTKKYWQVQRETNPSLRPEDERPLTEDELLQMRIAFNAGASLQAGDSRVPCAKLICEQYNVKLLEDLCSDLRASTRERKPTWKRKLSETPSSSASRKRSRSSL